MATEYSRETSVRKVCPDPAEGGSVVKLKVIDKISFIDEKAQYQEFQYSFNNGPSADRVVKKERVADILDVERIQKLSVIDAKDAYQESLFSFLTFQPGVHLKTHRKKIYALNSDGTKDESVWIEVERVDQISFVDPKTQHQEYIYELKWPDKSNPEWDYQNLTPVVTSYDKTSINPPWRLDPFQNIVDTSFGKWDYMIATLFWGGRELFDSILSWFPSTRYTTEQPVDLDLGSSLLLPDQNSFAQWYYHTNMAFADDSSPLEYIDGDSVLYNFASVRNALPQGVNDLIVSFRASWPQVDSNTSQGDVTLRLALFQGGTISENGNAFVWVNGATKSVIENVVTVTVTETGEQAGQLIARIKVPLNSGKWKVL